jgi:hypothetical protein
MTVLVTTALTLHIIYGDRQIFTRIFITRYTSKTCWDGVDTINKDQS